MKINTLFSFMGIFLFTFFIFSVFAIRGIDPHHDGLMLKTSLDVLSGQILYKETFTQYGSLTTYIQAMFMYIFGAQLIVLKLGTVGVYAATSVLQFAIGKKYLPLKLNLLVYFFWLIIAPFYRADWDLLSWSSSFALFFQLLSVLFFVNQFDSQSSRWHLFFCGLSAGATFWCRIPVGLTLIFAYLIIFGSCLILKNRDTNLSNQNIKNLIKEFKYFTAGCFSVFLIFFSILFFTQSLGDWHYQVLVAPRKWLQNSFDSSLSRLLWSLFYSLKEGVLLVLTLIILLFSIEKLRNQTTLTPKWKLWIYSLILISTGLFGLLKYSEASLDIFGGWASAIPIVLLGFFLVSCFQFFILKKTISESQLLVFFLTIISISSWHQYYPVTCYRHIFWGITPALGPFLMVCFYLSKSRVSTVIVTITALLFPMLKDRVTIAQVKIEAPYVKLASPSVLDGMYVQKPLAETISKVNEVIQKYLLEKPHAPVLLDGGDALYMTFVTNLTNPEPMFVNWGYSDQNSQEKRNNFIRTQRPIIIIENRSAETIKNYESTYAYKSRQSVNSIEVLIPNESISFK